MTIEEAEMILGLIGQYGEKEVRKAFRDKAKKYHPDVCAKNGVTAQTAAEKMAELNDAKTILYKIVAGGRVYTATPSAKAEPVNNTYDNVSSTAAAQEEYTAAPKTAESAPHVEEVKATEQKPNKATERMKKENEWESSFFYAFLERFPFWLVFVIAAWILPFMMVGTNPHTTVEVISDPAMNFLIFYVVAPFITLVNFLIPFHPIDWVIHRVSCGIYKAIRGAVYDMST